MNKWQLIVLWVMVGVICFVIFIAPKFVSLADGKFSVEKFENPMFTHFTNWNHVARYSIPTLLIGFSLILSLRNKRK